MRLHFTIRDLLWLTVVVAMGVAWWLDHRATSRLTSQELTIYLKRLEQVESNFDRINIESSFNRIESQLQNINQKLNNIRR